MSAARVFRVFRTLTLVGAVALAGCSTTGNTFDTSGLRYLEPGQTTLQQAAALLQGDPVDIYRRHDGSAVARWAHKTSVLTDALYTNQELWLSFDTQGRFQRIVKGNSIPATDLYQDGRRVDFPQVPVSYPLTL